MNKFFLIGLLGLILSANALGTGQPSRVAFQPKNYIINSNFDFWQRATSVSTVTWGADRWRLILSGATVTFSQQAATPGDFPVEATYFARVNATVADDNWGIEHYVEDVRALAGKTATLSFWAKRVGSTPSTLSIRLVQQFGTGGSTDVELGIVTVTLTTSWQKFVKTYSVSSIAGKTIGTDSRLRLFFYDATNETGTFDLAQIMLTEGPSDGAYALAGGTIAGELIACQRYYEKSADLASLPGVSSTNGVVYVRGGAASTTNVVAYVPYKVEKRRYDPTVTTWDGAGTPNGNKISTALGTSQTRTIDYANSVGFTVASDATAGHNYVYFTWASDAEFP